MNPLSMTGRDDMRHRAVLLVAVAIASIGLWQTQTGSMILYPFTILATWFHEMGHGITTLLTGSDFRELVIHPDGSGYAVSVRPADGSRIADALISAGGRWGPHWPAPCCSWPPGRPPGRVRPSPCWACS